MRRIVTGHTDSGKEAVLADDEVPAVTTAIQPGVTVHRVWELDRTPTLPVTEVPETHLGPMFPDPGGLRFGFISIAAGVSYELPADLTPEAIGAAAAEAEQKLPGMAAAFDRSRPGMHTTHSADFIVVVSGEGRMRTDDGTEVRLRPGDCVVQNGTAHVWLNDGDEPFVFAYSLAGAR
ncbi:cupin domain-containing protein [Streptomyces sp. NPDC047043]|uniref:cupin domain-containing protein n=1 Tax=Streptomyces sp. NPDC047043 TaxID=3154497 RepID=UPI0033CEFA16